MNLERLPDMGNSKNYFEHPGKVIETGGKFEHVMAISLDPRSHYREGVIRCIRSREGDVAVSGFIDRSVLYKVKGDSLEHFSIGNELKIKNQEKIVRDIAGEDADFLGLEDPDIWIDEKTGLMHLYFTMPFRMKDRKHYSINLGHAIGENLDSLVMTTPVLTGDEKHDNNAKELSIAPVNKQGTRLNLVESSEIIDDTWYSTVRVAIAEDMSKPWQFGETVFHPGKEHIPWIGGHASPGPLLPKNFIDVGDGKLLGFMNGREANQRVDGKIRYGVFSVGLFVYDYENGKIDWVSPEPFIIDSQARTITFASQFVEQERGSGILYAHVDDSFVRAYTILPEKLKTLLPGRPLS
ncbi:MAG: hypothetical protein KGJ13_05145 [Patescibacteria group bacterium]|nr:hypothetical protein [Patescibacteria group bacterium]